MASKTTTMLSPALRQLRTRAPRVASHLRASHLSATTTTPSPVLTTVRLAHSIPKPPSSAPKPATQSQQAEQQQTRQQREPSPNESPRPDIPANPQAYYQLSITCVPCGHRSHHNISKQGYQKGSILVACPECKNRHVIADHLKIFGEREVTVEDLLREKGQLVRRGSLSEDGDVEFWPEGAMEEESAAQ